MLNVNQTQSDKVAQLIANYRTIENVPDELLDENGAPRPVWTKLLDALAIMPQAERAERFLRGNQYLRDAGVFYRSYDAKDLAERDWPLSHMPVLIQESEWKTISAGLIQRAHLLEQVVADLYGANQLVANGHLPAAVVAGNPEWLRSLVGVQPRSGHFLHYLAFDIGRGPKGQWWVISDRTQAPSGAGFALENRIATARIYSEIFARNNVHRLAGFFRSFRDHLQSLRGDSVSRVGILTPGQMNDSYFEHAYIARYLGFMLLEGEDLTVRNDELMVRTVEGLKPIHILWRRLDAASTDPLELDERSRLGTAGLLSTVRSGNLALVNALGSGVLEARAFLAFLPRISEALTGQSLALPNVATWWCGQAKERQYVKDNLHRMIIGNAQATRSLFDLDDTAAIGGAFNHTINQSIETWVDEHANALVGQETVTLSTTPVFDGDSLVARPMSLRMFLARTADGWRVMPGGFARIGRSTSSSALALQNGGTSADVWIVSDQPVIPDTMLGSGDTHYCRQQPAMLPSRAADNLFWLGRYVERAEFTIRLLRAYHSRLAEIGSNDTPLLKLLAKFLKSNGTDISNVFPSSVAGVLGSASAAASQIRDRFSLDGWRALNDLSKTVMQMSKTAKPGDDMVRAMSVLLRKLSGLSGLVHENMYRFTGWRFFGIGRSLERAISEAALIAVFAHNGAPEGSLDLAVEVADSTMSLRSRFAIDTNRATVIDLLVLDPLNPRAIMCQLNDVRAHIEYLPLSDTAGKMSPLQRAILKIHTKLAVHTPEDLTTEALEELADELALLSTKLTAEYLA